jgi:type I restriction enzyme S subunit
LKHRANLNWLPTRLGDVAKIQSGAQMGRSGIVDPVALRYLRVANVQDGFLDLREVKTIQVSASEIDRYRLLPGDILMTEGGDADKLGRGHIWRGEIDPCLHQNHIFVARVDRTRLLPEFLAAYLTTPAGRLYFRRAAKQTTNLATINSSQLRALPLVLPELDEQAAMVKLLEGAEDTVRAADGLIERRAAYKKALAEDLLTGRRRFRGLSAPWRETKLREVFTEVKHLNSAGQIELVITVGKNAIRPQTERFSRVVASATQTDYNVINPGQFVYDPMSAYYGAMGQYQLSQPGIVSPVYRVLDVNSGFDRDFLRYLMKSGFFEYLVARASTQGNKDGKRRGLQREAFLAIKLPLPGTDEQRRIAELLGALDAEIALLRKQRDALNEQKKGLTQKLLTGEVRLKEFR